MVDFLVIGPFACITYNVVFPLIMSRIIILGHSRVGEFCDGSKFGNINWFTTFDIDRPPFLELTKTYNGSYKKFDNYDAINVDKTIDIPDNYSGVMGVPITFLEKWNPGQFDVVGLLNDGCYIDEDGLQGAGGLHMTSIDGKSRYVRLLIRRRK